MPGTHKVGAANDGHEDFSEECWSVQTSPPCSTVRVQIITDSLVIIENLLPQNYRYRYRLESRMNSLITITVTVLASAVTPSSPLIPNYHLESRLN